MACNCCFEDYISNCTTSLQVNAILLPLTEYTWIITDKDGNKYSGTETTDDDGYLTIALNQLPEGLFTQYSGNFKLEIQDGSCKPINFMIAGSYNCISFNVTPGTFVKNNLGCDVEAVSLSPFPPQAGNAGKFLETDGAAVHWVSALPYKVYTALLTQSGTNAPVATVLQNTLGNVTFEFVGDGQFNVTSTGLFTIGKTVIITTPIYNVDADKLVSFSGWLNTATDSAIQLFSRDPGDTPVIGLNKAFFEIRVYN